ncbi:LysR family transcriptional regulator [Sphingomonas sp. YL-JM2C]
MDQLSCIKTFIEVAQTKSFTLAARRRGLSRASATKHVAALEKMVGARLLTRNSQFVSLTEAGITMLEGGVRLIEDLEGLGEKIQGRTAGLVGTVRVGVPPSFGAHHLIPAISAFFETVEDVEISLFLDDGSSNLVSEGLDVSIRIGETLQSTDEVAKLLGHAPQAMVAAPSYVDKFGMPCTPHDLREHRCLIHTLKSPSDNWAFDGPEGHTIVRVSGPIRANFGDPLLSAALMGEGITIHPNYMVREYVEAGRLVVLMPDYVPTGLRIHAVFPQRRFLPARIRVFLDFIKKWLVQNSQRLDGTLPLSEIHQLPVDEE